MEASEAPNKRASGFDALSALAGRQSGLVITAILIVFMMASSIALGINAIQVLVTGLALGSLYAVIALGYTMVYGIIELINFAHGDVFALGAFISLTVLQHIDKGMSDYGQYTMGRHPIHLLGSTFHIDAFWLIIWALFVSMLVSALICGVIGIVIERIAYRPLRNAPKLAPLITAIGVSFIIENLIFQWRGGVPISYPSVLQTDFYQKLGPLDLGTQVSNVEVVAIGSAIVLMLLLDRFVNRTKMGKAMRAVAQDPEAALMMGINVDRIIALTFFVGSALAGAGAVIYGVHETIIGSTMGFSLGLFAFTSAVLGGIGNIRGAMLGGILIGVIKRFVDQLGNGSGTEWADPVVFAILILVLVFRPSGLLGSQIPEKV